MANDNFALGIGVVAGLGYLFTRMKDDKEEFREEEWSPRFYRKRKALKKARKQIHDAELVYRKYKGRKGPAISATSVKRGTRRRGNDGKMWVVRKSGKSQRWFKDAESFEAEDCNHDWAVSREEISIWEATNPPALLADATLSCVKCGKTASTDYAWTVEEEWMNYDAESFDAEIGEILDEKCDCGSDLVYQAGWACVDGCGEWYSEKHAESFEAEDTPRCYCKSGTGRKMVLIETEIEDDEYGDMYRGYSVREEEWKCPSCKKTEWIGPIFFAESFEAEDCKNVKAFVEYTCIKCDGKRGFFEVEDGNFYQFAPDIGDCSCGGFEVNSNEFITCQECDDYFHHRGDGWAEHLRIIMDRKDAESFRGESSDWAEIKEEIEDGEVSISVYFIPKKPQTHSEMKSMVKEYFGISGTFPSQSHFHFITTDGYDIIPTTENDGGIEEPVFHIRSQSERAWDAESFDAENTLCQRCGVEYAEAIKPMSLCRDCYIYYAESFEAESTGERCPNCDGGMIMGDTVSTWVEWCDKDCGWDMDTDTSEYNAESFEAESGYCEPCGIDGQFWGDGKARTECYKCGGVTIIDEYKDAESFEAEERWYLSDPCYAIPDDRWDEFCDLMFAHPNYYKNAKMDIKWEVDGEDYIVEVWDSPGGDGTWKFSFGEFGVDAGVLAIIPEKVAMQGGYWDDDKGLWIEEIEKPDGGMWFDEKPTLYTDTNDNLVRINGERNQGFHAESFEADEGDEI